MEGATHDPGQGVRGEVDGVEVRLGSPLYCGAESEAARLFGEDPEVSVVAFSRGAERYAFAVRQRLRADAARVIAGLRQAGLAIEILSGDRDTAVRFAAEQLGVSAWRARMTPAGKIARIEALQRAGHKVMMVGDGLNDAPSLAAATVSMSPISATHLSQAAADLVFLGRDLAPVMVAVSLSRKAVKLMRQNLVLAIGYNFLAVPLAIVGMVTPLIAAAAMSGSSLLVMLNALRARSASREMA